MNAPTIVLSFPGIAFAVVAAMILGFLWYGPVFGRRWAHELGLNFEDKPPGMGRALLLQVIGLTLTAYVLAHANQVWRPSVWGAGEDAPAAVYGFFGGLFTWFGFYLPPQLGRVAWEKRSWHLFLINTGHDFMILQAMSQILAHLHG